jgi:Endonuclease-reverse transcriptase
MGDFNYPDINYNNQVVVAGPDSPAHRFFDKTRDLFLVQYVDQCTRFREGYMPSTLDHIFVTEPGLVDDMEYQASMGKSDHVCIEWSLTVHKAQEATSSKLKRDFWKGDYVKINDKWMIFIDKLLLLVDRYVPFKAAFKKKESQISQQEYYNAY